MLLVAYQAKPASPRVGQQACNWFFLRGAPGQATVPVRGSSIRSTSTAIKRPIFAGTGNHCAALAAGRRPPTKARTCGWPSTCSRAPRETWSQTRCIASSMYSSPIMLRIRDTPACISWRLRVGGSVGSCCGSCYLVSCRGWRMYPAIDWLSRQDWDAVVLPAPPQPAADWAQRCRKAVGTKESESSICL